MPYTRPEPLTSDHIPTGFQCQHASLSDWLIKRALANQNNLASKTFVVTDGERVVGYYALASGSVALESAPGAIRRNMPAPMPAIVLGRLAVDDRHQRQSLGRSLLKDATLRAIGAAETVAARVLLCHSIDEAAKAFYIANGFAASTVDPLMVMLDLKKALAIAAG
jgi:GNAT superfamily N-acetyltransferase